MKVYSISGRLARRVALLVGVALTVIVALIYATTAMLMENKQATERAEKINVIQYVAREYAARGGVLPLHPGARRYFKEVGLD